MGTAWWQVDWVWMGTGWVLCALGVAVMGWALLWDRAKGRRRCPKCWYDMAGVPGLRCSECGREAKREQGLLRTRRRWRWAWIGVLVLAGAWVACCVPRMRVEGWMGLAPTPSLGAVVILLREGATTNEWPRYLRSKEVADYVPRVPTLRERVLRASSQAVAARVKRGEVGKRTRFVGFQLTKRVMNADLNEYPPRADGELREMMYAFSTAPYPARDAEIAGLAAPYFELMAHPIAGSPVYAMVRGEGVGDTEAEIDITTSWRSTSIREVRMHTTESAMREALISTPGLTYDAIVDLGTPPEGATSVRVTTSVRRFEYGQWGKLRTAARVRTVDVPVDVRPRSEDRLVPVQADVSRIREVVEMTLARAPYREELELGIRTARDLEWNERSLKNMAASTLGARLQVLHDDGRVLAEGEMCVWEDQVLAAYPWGYAFFGWGSLEVEARLRPVGSETVRSVLDARPRVVRVICDPDIARQNPYCTEYFAGTFEIPLRTR